jgi:lipid-A-disaccharide synthase
MRSSMNQQMKKILTNDIRINRNICIVTGEASGDAQAALLLQELYLRFGGESSYSFWGIGGSLLQKSGMEIVWHIDQLAVFGVIEIIKHYFKVAGIFKSLLREIEKRQPDLIIVVDYPGFNLRLAEEAKLRGFKIVYYIPPKVWAHGLSRIEKLKKYTSSIISILPFEVDFFKQYQLKTMFVGNPLYDKVVSFLSQKKLLKISKKIPPNIDNVDPTIVRSYPYVIGLLPGSRKAEIERMLPVMIEAFVKLSFDFPNIVGQIPLASTISFDFLNNIFLATCDKLGVDAHILQKRITIFTNNTYDVMFYADYVWVCSGTASLEVAFFKTPSSVIYKVNPITAVLVRLFIKIKYASLVNLCMNDEVIPEFLQNNATVENLVGHAKTILLDSTKRNQMLAKLDVLSSFFPKNAAQHAADVILDQLP